RSTNNVACGDGDVLAIAQFNASTLELADTNLWTAQIRKDCHRGTDSLRGSADGLVGSAMAGVIAMRTGGAGDIDPGTDQLLEDGRLFAGRADGGDNASAPAFQKRHSRIGVGHDGLHP